MEIWTEKYRPKRLRDVAGQKEAIKRIVSFVKEKSLPHLLFTGPAGTGKTTTAICIARELFGEEYRQNILELNASDERGIDVIRHKVKDFARLKAFGDAPYKLVYLDESDALTTEAQQALRRTMENYARTCRFILSCNYSSKIIEPIQSRCSIFRFRPIKEEDLMERVSYIVGEEKVDVDEEAIRKITELSEGDLRNAINMLQTAASTGKHVDVETIYEVTSQANPDEVKKVLEKALAGRFKEARKELEDILIRQGLSGLDLIKQMHKTLLELEIEDKAKVELIDKIGEYEFRLVEGSDERIQLDALLAQFTLYGKK